MDMSKLQMIVHGVGNGLIEGRGCLKETRINPLSLCGRWVMRQVMEKILKIYTNG